MLSEIQKLKFKRMLDVLESANGNGTSMITVLIPSGGNINLIKQKLTDEYTAARQVKSRL
jgi:peptide chain release factor subunit 1